VVRSSHADQPWRMTHFAVQDVRHGSRWNAQTEQKAWLAVFKNRFDNGDKRFAGHSDENVGYSRTLVADRSMVRCNQGFILWLRELGSKWKVCIEDGFSVRLAHGDGGAGNRLNDFCRHLIKIRKITVR